MKRYMLMILSLTFIIVLGACSNNLGNMNPFDMMDSSGDRSEGSMMMGHGHSDVPLQHSAGENELKIPSVLQKDKEEGNDVYYTIEAQKGQTEIFEEIGRASCRERRNSRAGA